MIILYEWILVCVFMKGKEGLGVVIYSARKRVELNEIISLFTKKKKRRGCNYKFVDDNVEYNVRI